MRRRLFIFASLLSLLLCVATVVLWAWAHVLPDHKAVGIGLGNAYTSSRWSISFYDSLTFSRAYQFRPLPHDTQKEFFYYLAASWNHFGILYNEQQVVRGSDERMGIPMSASYGEITLVEFNPLWPISLTALLPVLQYLLFVRRRHKRRQEGGRCIACSYNLTGNISGTCPECGTAIPTSRNKENPRPA